MWLRVVSEFEKEETVKFPKLFKNEKKLFENTTNIRTGFIVLFSSVEPCTLVIFFRNSNIFKGSPWPNDKNVVFRVRGHDSIGTGLPVKLAVNQTNESIKMFVVVTNETQFRHLDRRHVRGLVPVVFRVEI